MEIRPEQPADFAAISVVVRDAFNSPLEPRLVDAIRATPEYVPDLALVDGDARLQVCTLSPLAVAPDVHGAGIGSALVREVVSRADAMGEPLVVLEGNPRYYGRFGFEHAAPAGITIHLPDWAPSEAGQVIRLRTYDRSLRGTIEYSAAFAEVIDH